jgi:hypothetical protein
MKLPFGVKVKVLQRRATNVVLSSQVKIGRGGADAGLGSD